MSRPMVLRRVTAIVVLLSAARPAAANERHFSFAYESPVLVKGGHEIEVSTSWFLGRHDPYARLEQRGEYEVGLTDRLQTSLYLNWTTEAVYDPASGQLNAATEARGVSSEWKLKLADPVGDPVGLAVYAELGLAADEAELETKLIADKLVGPLLVAYNLTAEPEWHTSFGAFTEEYYSIDHSLAASFNPAPHWFTGVELWQPTVVASGQTQHAAVFAGPVLHASAGEFWITVTALAQLPALKRSVSEPDSTLVLDGEEHYAVRILVSLPL